MYEGIDKINPYHECMDIMLHRAIRLEDINHKTHGSGENDLLIEAKHRVTVKGEGKKGRDDVTDVK